MKRMPILLLFAVLAWPWSDKTLLLAQETPRLPSATTPSSEETTINLNDPPTPQSCRSRSTSGPAGRMSVCGYTLPGRPYTSPLCALAGYVQSPRLRRRQPRPRQVEQRNSNRC